MTDNSIKNKKIKIKISGAWRFALKNSLGGFTLVELILYIAISSLFLTGVIQFAFNLVYGRVRSFYYQEVNQNIRLVSKRIIFEIRNSSSATVDSATQITLNTTDSGRDPTVINLSDGRIRIGYGTSGNCPTTNPCNLTSNIVNVSSLNFTNLSSGNSSNIKFSMTIETSGSTSDYQQSQSYSGSAEVRSK